jgi:CheY-like chemotaxis protein
MSRVTAVFSSKVSIVRRRCIADIWGVPATLIVVEDDGDVRDLAVAILRDAGYNVLQAMNGGIALVLLQQEIPVDLLFTDIVMPGDPDGFELGRLAREMRPEIRILYTTGYAGPVQRPRHGPLLGRILRKPYRRAELLAEVAELVNV